MSLENSANLIDDNKADHTWDEATVRLEGLARKYQRQSQGVTLRTKKVRHLNEVHAHLKLGKGEPLVAESSDESLDGAFLDVLDKMESQIRRRKGKRVKRLKRKGKTIRLIKGFFCSNEGENGGLHAESP